jgi:translation initiation factor IF-3
LSRPFTPRNISPAAFIRVNGKIRARDVRVIGVDNKQIGIISLNEALGLARTHGVDLVEISPNAVPPVCRLVDFGKYRYELSKKDKDSKKRQNASLVKEVQLSPRIDPHDLSIKTDHAIGFLCEDMKVKIALKFRGREMAHTEVGFEVINKFVASIAAYGHPDFQPKLVGRAINLMISPLPRAKRPKSPHEEGEEPEQESAPVAPAKKTEVSIAPAVPAVPAVPAESAESAAPAATPPVEAKVPEAEAPSASGLNTPFTNLDIK